MSGQLKNDTGERKLRVTLLSAGWKASSNGDLTTINRELAIQMAKHPNVEVSVFLPQCSEEDKKDADSYNVKLIEAVKLSGFEPVDWLASVPEGHAMDCVLGHGVALGRQIQIIKKNPNYSHCKWIQFVHTSPEEIGMYKSISEGQKLQQTEIELCEMADQVVTIGPKLTDTYENQLGKGKVFNLTPSILTEFLDVQQARDERRTFCVLVTESGDSEDFDVKGYDIAVKAITNLKDKSYQLKFASKQRGTEDELADKLLQCGIGRNQLIICSFDENRETLANLFSVVDIVILPSKTEGFGLSALEAISAGLPVLVSGNSGIAEALREVPNGSQCIVDSEDPADWARAINAVRNKKRKVRLAEAKILCENYLQQFSWEESCDLLVKKMCNLVFDQKLNIKIEVEHVELAELDGYSTASASALELAGYQRASTASGVKRKRQSDTDLEDLQPLEKKVLCLIAMNYLDTTPPQSRDERSEFQKYLQEMKVLITGVSVGSLVITVKCNSLKSLEKLWQDYLCGLLDKMVGDCFVTEKILKELNLAELKLKTTMDVEEYNACKLSFLKKDALRGASSSEFHSISSTSESPRKQEELKKWEQKTKNVETEKPKGTSPFTVVPTTGHGKELIEKEQGRKGMLPLHRSSTSDPEKKLEELLTNLKKQVTCSICLDIYTEPKTISCLHTYCCECLEKHARVSQRQGKFRCPECQVEIDLPEGNRFDCLPNSFLHKSLLSVFQAEGHEGTSPSNELFTAGHKKKWEVRHNTGKFQEKEGSSSPPLLPTTDLEEKLGKVCEEIMMLRMEGSSPPPVSTIEIELEELLKKLQKGRMEGSSSPPPLPTTDLEEKLGKVYEEIKMLRMEGSSPPPVSTIEIELEELLKKLQKGRMEGSSSPPPLSTTDLEEKLGKVCEEIKMLRTEGSSPPPVSTTEVELEELLKKLQKGRMEGSSSPPTLPTTDLEEKLGKVCEKIERLSVKGTLPPPELFTADFGEELKQLCKELNRQRMKGRSPHPVSIIRVVIGLQKVRMEALENAMYQTIRSGLAKFDVSLPEELQSYVSYLLNELAKLGLRRQVLQSPCAMEELRKVMNKNELKTFLTIHIREGAWQVVLLFMDELPKYKLSRDWYPKVWDEDEMFRIPLYSSKSGILRAWPTEYDPGLVTLCKAITNRDWKVTRLILSSSRTSDEGFKILSKALTQSELYSLTLYCIGLQSQGLKHLCEALISGDCNLTRLNVSNNRLGDEGILHLCNPLTNGNCTLTSLNVSDNMLGDEGIVHLCNALTSVNCKLTSLNVSDNTLGDEGIMHLCNALTSVNCTLTSLNVSDNRLGDKGIVYLCKALTDTKCKLKSLNLHANWNVTDVGQKYLFQMLTGTDWEVRGGLRLSRSTRKRSKSQVSGTEP